MLLKIEINFLNIPIPPIIFFSWKFYGEVKKESIFKTIEFSQNVVYKYVSCFSRNTRSTFVQQFRSMKREI